MPILPSFNESFTSFFTFIFFISPLILLLIPYLKSKPNKNLPPSPPKLPIIGNLHQLGRNPHLCFRRLSQKFGPIFLLQLGQIPTLVVSSPKIAKQVFKTHDLAFSSRPFLFSAQHIFYNCTDIVFSPYGSYWRQVRKICILQLLSARRVQSFSLIRQQEVARLVDRISHSKDRVNLSSLLGLYANDVLCRAALGREFSAGGEYHLHGFQKLLEEYQILLGGFCIGDLFPSLAFLSNFTGMKSRLVRTANGFDKLFDQVIAEHLDPEREKLEESQDLVDILLEIQKNGSDDKIPLTMDNVKAIILDMFAAGTDTTFIALDWGMTELITHPNAMKRAQSEIRRVVGDRRNVTESDLLEMPYLKAVVKEVLRLHPPAPVLVPRETTEDVRIEGYDIPAKTRVFVNAWGIGRDPESWKDPETFEPERFLGSEVDYGGLDFEFIPFGAGRRICPGITMGIATIELALAQILHSFDWELPNGIEAKDLDMTEVFGITMHRKAHLEAVPKPYFT
ncbi:cytochrome P450 71A1-like [Cucumis melo var. makuwa]|uniref:Cytochrome P450 71A1-like n=2 Tax=Cucumis melo TaxID=3656 RepID=A0A5D3BIU1_CUCMM|nr:cytochrome P450 71A1-like [Cucumis melo var. makuwa]TYJ99203.1 cytochrome P450 71A1-like [Cucumis melo var. makuwa]